MANSSQAERRTCFVAMPITTPKLYVEKLGDADHFAHVLDHLFTPALEKAGYSVIPPTTFGSELIHAEIIKNLEQADLVLCDLSSLNPNVFFELGIRTSLDRAVAIVKDSFTSSIPFDLSAINILTYDGSLSPWTLAEEVERIASHIARIARSTNEGNAMWHYFGLTKRATPSTAGSNPVEAKLDLLLNEMTRLQMADFVSADESAAVSAVEEAAAHAAAALVARTAAEKASAYQLLKRQILRILSVNGITGSEISYTRNSSLVVVSTTETIPEQVTQEIKQFASRLGLVVQFHNMLSLS
jgi:hypothetical protein